MAGKIGQGKLQQLILGELDARPLLYLRELNPDGKRSLRKALHRSARKLLQAGVLDQIKVIVPSSPVPSVHSLVARAGTCILGMPTVIRTENETEPAENGGEGEIPMTLDERIANLQERINS